MLTGLDLLSTDALRAVERAAIAQLGGDAQVLMQRAGQAAWRQVLTHWPDAQRIGVLCGPGNNGGDGYVLARLALQSGRTVRLLCLPEHAPRTPLAQQMQAEFLACGGQVLNPQRGFPDVDVWVDALFGIGLTRAPDAASAAVIEGINLSGAAILALDVPSGLNADTGHAAGAVIRADRTVEFIAAHVGNRTGAAADCVGSLAVADLDVPASVLDAQTPAARWLHAGALARAFKPRQRSAHKGQHGHVLCVGGDHGGGGAIVMAAEAALRSGAGLVSVATVPAHVAGLLARRPECMAHGLNDAAELAPLLERASVIALGPGLGRSAWAQDLLQAALACAKPLVLDADALNLLAEGVAKLTPCTDAILTPHPGEAARLLGCTIADVQRDRLGAAAALVQRYQAVVVLKGAGSIVAAPAQTPVIIGVGNPGMAVGGMGDVLTGIIAASRAQGFASFHAASIGALLHAVAADDAAAQGQRGLLPSDVISALRGRINPPHLRP